MNILLFYLILAISGKIIESQDCVQSLHKGTLRPFQFRSGGVCDRINCGTIQVCSDITGSLDWTDICFNNDWNLNSINVYCRQFGYLSANNVSELSEGRYFSEGTYGNNMIKLSNVICVGNEDNLLSCGYGTTMPRCRYPLYDPSDHCCNQTDCLLNLFSTSQPTSSSSLLSIALTSSVETTETTSLPYSSITSSQYSSSSMIVSTYAAQSTSLLSSSSPTTQLAIEATPDPNLITTGIESQIITMTSFKPTPTFSNVVLLPLVSVPTISMNKPPASILSSFMSSDNTNIIMSTAIDIGSITKSISNAVIFSSSSGLGTTDSDSAPTPELSSSRTLQTTSTKIAFLATPDSNSITRIESQPQPTSQLTSSFEPSPIYSNVVSRPPSSIQTLSISVLSSSPMSSDNTNLPSDSSEIASSSESNIIASHTSPPSDIYAVTTDTSHIMLISTPSLNINDVSSTSTSGLGITNQNSMPTPELSSSRSLPTTSIQPTDQESRVTLMLIPILVPIVIIIATLIIVIVVILIVSFIFCSRKKGKNQPSDYETPMCNHLIRITSPSHQVESTSGPTINGDSNYYAAINETNLIDNEYVYADLQMRTLERGNNQDNSEPFINHYAMFENEPYEGFVEGEVGDRGLYDQLPGMDQPAYYKLVVISNLLENPLYDPLVVTNPANEDPIYIEPPSSLPQLEDVFGQCLHEISREHIQMGEEFASGQFGVVYRAVYHTGRGDIPVAIKTLKEAANTDTKVAFMREAAILAQFQHPNVLRLIGVLTAQQPCMMVTELLKTELAELLLKMKSTDPAHIQNLPPLLLRFSQEIAAGMSHMAERHFIHRDLASRNVLVAKDLSCRIADFGMSRELGDDSDYYTSSGGRIPLRWTAPEAVLYKKYSEKSDVWSFGMTMYEIWSLGDKPWGLHASNDEIIEGMCDCRKLSPPTGCPREVYRVMVETWRADASSRPTFSEALLMLTEIQLPPPVPGICQPAHCIGNDPLLAKDHYLDLQQIQ